MQIPFNKPFMTGNELEYIRLAVASGKISGDGLFSSRCHRFFQERFGIAKALLTPSCTAGLEMTALLMDLKEGDEVIMPSFTFVSTANAYVLRGAKVVFADSLADNPNVDTAAVAALITPRTRAIIVVHYAGMACDMSAILALARQHGLWVVEDAAQAIDAYHLGKPLGSLGDFGVFSFHETKNVISGEGGLLAVNNPRFAQRAEIIREKGTNRSAFFRGEVDKYGWVDVGSSYLPSEIVAAFLFAQLERLDDIQQRRRATWDFYNARLAKLAEQGVCQLPQVPIYGSNNAHMFYLVCGSQAERQALIQHLACRGVHAVFHYIPLHGSKFYQLRHDGRELPNADRFGECLMRLPLYYDMEEEEADHVASGVLEFYDALSRKRSDAVAQQVPEHTAAY